MKVVNATGQGQEGQCTEVKASAVGTKQYIYNFMNPVINLPD